MADEDRREFDFEFRPESYWESADAIFANVKGEWRRKKIRRAVEDGSVDEVPPEVFADSLDDKIRRKTGAIHPSMMGGEYLPDYLPAEIEVARISLRSTTGDVIALRARPEKTGIAFRWSDEYEDDGKEPFYVIGRHGYSENPLSLGELIELFKSTKCPDYQHRPNSNIIQMFRDDQWDEWDGCSAEEAAEFSSVSSEFYPELERWYTADTKRWYQEETRELVYQGPQRPSADQAEGDFAVLLRLAQFVRRRWPKPIQWDEILRHVSKITPANEPLAELVREGILNPSSARSFSKLAAPYHVTIEKSEGGEVGVVELWVTHDRGPDFLYECRDVIDLVVDYALRNDLPLPSEM